MTTTAEHSFTRYDQKLEFILRNSARIFARKGFHSTSMRDIARETGVSLSGLYYYCKSKEELLFLIQDNCFGRVLKRLDERLPGAASAAEKLLIFIENHLSFFAANMAEMKVLSHEIDTLAGELRSRVSRKKNRYTRLARRILAEVQQSLSGAPGRIDLTVATYALFGMTTWIYNWYDPEGRIKVAELARAMTQLFLGGLLNGPEASGICGGETCVTETLSVWRGAAEKRR